MRPFLFALSFLVAGAQASAQTYLFSGYIADSDSTPLRYATVTLLDPTDSTLIHFGISMSDGTVEIKDVTAGEYLLQASCIGFRTLYKPWRVPADGSSFGLLRLAEKSTSLEEVSVVGEKVPIAFKGDTLEYNAGAFKVKSDATVEDLLKKLPGMQVNRAGEIEAQGKTVNKVLVDGKEFFGADPKMATRNLPADAINKVQVFDGASDQARFSGIDDGQRDKTINLSLKDSKKAGSFGDASAGGGTDERFKASAKLYRFRKASQFAALGMLNNVNQFGFTLSDYLNFQGGLLGGGGSMRLNARDAESYPVDLGMPAIGAITSGAAGVNYTTEPKTGRRLNISYLGNGADKHIDRDIFSRSTTDHGLYEQREENYEHSFYNAHRFSASWKGEHDSTTQWIFNGNGSWQRGNSSSTRDVASTMAGKPINSLNGWQSSAYTDASVRLKGSYQKKLRGAWPILRANIDANMGTAPSRNEWRNTTDFPVSGIRIADQQYQENSLHEYAGSARLSAVRSMGGSIFVEPEVTGGFDRQGLQREQGRLEEADGRTDSLSFLFSRQYGYARGGVGLQKNSTRSQFHAGLQAEAGSLQPLLSGNTAAYVPTITLYFLPALSWNFQPKSGVNFHFDAGSEVRTPDAEQMLPVVTYRNPLLLRYGNPSLRPSLAHQVSAHFSHFDQFSFRFLSLYTNWSYERHAVSSDVVNRPDLSQTFTFINAPYRARGRGGAMFNTPIRPLGATFNARVAEGWNESIGFVNGIRNEQTTWSHELSLSLENRRKKVWDVQGGGSVLVSAARYSVNTSLNNRYYRFTGFSQISVQPTDRWYLAATADLNFYTASTFPEAVWIPLLKAEASYKFLKSRRGIITFEGFDLLNRNTGVQRAAQGAMLTETRSNVIGRYAMLSFKYRLNKFGDGGSGPQMNVRTVRE